ncbi:drug/metabolite transporter [Marinospirillum sp. MEB164]|uniref:Drug/metabolite transporter n=1 Tax=Marinospirillum alkalitolerans TaxID=3123374 RepID=A0ABW8PT37_9GAMM
MTSLAVALVLCSAAMHAGWNLLGKGQAPSLAFFTLALFSGGLIFAPSLFWQPDYVALPALFWWWLLLSGFFQAIYLAGLAWAYARGAVSVLYPLARALPVLLVPLVGWLLLEAVFLVARQWVALVMIVLASLLLPFVRLKDIRLRHYWTPALGFALLAALGTTGYTLVDQRAMQLMNQQLGQPVVSSVHYMVLQAWFSLLWMLPVVWWMPSEKRALSQLWGGQKRGFITAGVLVLGTYGFVLLAMTMTDQVSMIVALRQASIPLGALGGMMLFKESLSPLKLAALVLMTSGLIVMTF